MKHLTSATSDVLPMRAPTSRLLHGVRKWENRPERDQRMSPKKAEAKQSSKSPEWYKALADELKPSNMIPDLDCTKNLENFLFIMKLLKTAKS
ncbi:hypothetical protein GMDG_00741 [Pseudogymnoascus destructans 20631-21]|uniref:Uncharacterized protein n=1 Tax=Pseudogymnoascus destructans (strain ATCC MYA-4855 / 20631-21) TaxID=658429 RepID=L8GBG1_PSED2|nr:hypothetical protein GMDG_00741 [Pseudogymnoascus destructans 20631-21]